MILGLLLRKITNEDLESLVGTSSEDEFVDFKESAYPAQPDDPNAKDDRERKQAKEKWKTDLCTDISAFANAGGGLIICGMREKGGVATELTGLGADTDAEREIDRLQKVADSGIDPPVYGLSFQDVQLGESNKAIVIKIPRSFGAPHRVKLTKKFHIRRAKGNDDMTLSELRLAFNAASAYVQQARQFRHERLESITQEKDELLTPVQLADGVRLVLHVIPFGFSDPGSYYNLLAPFQTGVTPEWAWQNNTVRHQFNHDGFALLGKQNGTNKYLGYVQVFRNGIVEAVDVYEDNSPEGKEKSVHLFWVEGDTLKNLRRAMGILSSLQAQPPFVVSVCLANTYSYRLFADDRLRKASPNVFRHRIVTPDALVQSYDQDPRQILKSSFDMLWNTAGYVRSLSYDNEGNWVNKHYK